MIYSHVYGSAISGSSADRAQQQYEVPGLHASDYSCLKYILSVFNKLINPMPDKKCQDSELQRCIQALFFEDPVCVPMAKPSCQDIK